MQNSKPRLSSEMHRSVAELLWNARIDGKAIPPLSTSNPEITISDAYAISTINANRRCKIPKIKSIGKKIGLTSRAVQKQLGVEQPDFGYLTNDMVIENGSILPAKKLIQGKAEGEIAFTLKKSLRGPSITINDVYNATDYIQPCIEIIDSRIENWKIKIQDTIADNASSAFFVTSAEKYLLKNFELEKIAMNLWVNQELKSQGIGSACLDHPCNAVAWLANALAEFDIALEAGDIILSGAYGPVVPIAAGTEYTVEMETMGKVNFRVE